MSGDPFKDFEDALKASEANAPLTKEQLKEQIIDKFRPFFVAVEQYAVMAKTYMPGNNIYWEINSVDLSSRRAEGAVVVVWSNPNARVNRTHFSIQGENIRIQNPDFAQALGGGTPSFRAQDLAPLTEALGTFFTKILTGK